MRNSCSILLASFLLCVLSLAGCKGAEHVTAPSPIKPLPPLVFPVLEKPPVIVLPPKIADISDRAKVLAVASSQVGVSEKGENRGTMVDKYNDAARIDMGSAWCASFVFWVSLTALGPDTPFPRTGRAIIMGKQQSLNAESHVRGGDTFFVGFYSHTGLFEQWGSGPSCITIEGNTTASGATPGQDREGSGVFRKKRLKASMKYWAQWIKD